MYNYINVFDFLTTGFFVCDQKILVILRILKPELAQKINRFSKHKIVVSRRERNKTWKTPAHPKVTSLEAYCICMFLFMQTKWYKIYGRNPLERLWQRQESMRHHSKSFRS